MPFHALGVCDDLCRALAAGGYLQPFPIQAQAVPVALAGRDLVAVAPTGSGKTAAFVLPILQNLGPVPADGRRPVQALVLVPTRELAAQVGEAFRVLGQYRPEPARVRVVHGGVAVNPQMLALRGGAEVLVATPGRLLDLAGRNAVRLDRVRTLVLDEADRMLDLGFRLELEQILALLPAVRQTLLFSATRDRAALELLRPALREPLEIGLEQQSQPPAAVKQRAYLVAEADKGPLLRHLIERGGWAQVLVFVASHRRADTVVRKLLNNGIQALAMHGDLSQGARTGALAGFKAGATRVLVATDLAARGLDIEDLPCVINYELPRSANDYVHRVGRTGRAGAEGLALSLVAPAEEAHLKLIEKRTGQRIPRLDGAAVTS
jgi:ATP-dependent RNA helicase RhlE